MRLASTVSACAAVLNGNARHTRNGGKTSTVGTTIKAAFAGCAVYRPVLFLTRINTMDRPLTQAEQLAQLVAGKPETRDVNARGVDDGYILTGQRRWMDTGMIVAQQQFETIAEDHASASAKIAHFLANGAFPPVSDPV